MHILFCSHASNVHNYSVPMIKELAIRNRVWGTFVSGSCAVEVFAACKQFPWTRTAIASRKALSSRTETERCAGFARKSMYASLMHERNAACRMTLRNHQENALQTWRFRTKEFFFGNHADGWTTSEISVPYFFNKFLYNLMQELTLLCSRLVLCSRLLMRHV